MLEDVFSEAGRLVIGLLFTVGLIALCKWWPFGRREKHRE